MTQHTTTKATRIDATVRNAALKLLANGDATVAEIAELVKTSRQRVQYWADQAKIDVNEKRTTHLRWMWGDMLLRVRLVRTLTPVPKRKR